MSNQKIISRDMYQISIDQKIMHGNLRKDTNVYLTKQGADGKMYNAVIKWEEFNTLVDDVKPAIKEYIGIHEKSHIVEQIKRQLIEKNLLDKANDPLVGKLEATVKHLEDMRELVFGKEEIQYAYKEDNKH